MATSAAVIRNGQEFKRQRATRVPRGLDTGMLAGIAIAVIALAAGVAITGVSARYFFNRRAS
jgi:hypothetical protein